MNALSMVDDPSLVGKRENLRSETEANLLGCLLMDPAKIDEISEVVDPSDIVHVPYRKLYSLVVGMREARQPVTFASVLVAAKRNGLIDELGGASAYGQLVQSLPNSASYRAYANEVSRLSACRKAELAGLEFMRTLARPDCDPRQAIDALVGRVQDIGITVDEHSKHIADIMREVHAEGALPEDAFSKQRIKTGYPSLDTLIGGLYPKNLYLLGGYFGSGKSAMAADLGAHGAAAGKSVLLFSVEMTGSEFAQRVLSIEAGVSMNAWQRPRTQDEQDRIASVADYAEEWRWWIDDTSRQTIHSIRAASRLRKVSDGLDIIIIDNLALIQSYSHEKKVDRYKATTEELKRLSRELDCCILLIAQLNADAAGNEPNSTSWADCKSIEGDADVAMMLHRIDETDEYKLIVTKNRSRGPRGKVPLRWDGQFQRFTDDVSTAVPWDGSVSKGN
jgi:replicative DNA helicase